MFYGLNSVSKQAKTNCEFVKQTDTENGLWEFQKDDDDDEGRVNGQTRLVH